jgi:hypothetical protein
LNLREKTQKDDENFILWRICSKQELWSERNSCFWVLPTHKNRGIVTIPDMMHTAVAMEQLSKHVSAETNSRNNRRAVFSVRSVLRGYKNDKEDV